MFLLISVSLIACQISEFDEHGNARIRAIERWRHPRGAGRVLVIRGLARRTAAAGDLTHRAPDGRGAGRQHSTWGAPVYPHDFTANL
jgi:hypothetical protein